MSDRPKLVFITSRFPYPLEKGDKLRAFHFIKGLSKSYEITLIALTDQSIADEWLNELAPFALQTHVFKLSKPKQIFRLGLNFFLHAPFQVAYFTESKVKRQINQILKNLKPDHIYCQLIRAAEYVKNYHDCYKTLDYMDALSKGMERRMENAPFYAKFIYRMEATRLREYERRIFNYFEFHTMISLQDTYYIAHPEQTKIKVVPNGIDTQFFSPMDSVHKEFDLVFVGNLSYAPNVDAMVWFEKNVLQKNKDLRILIAGASPSQKILQLQKRNSHIVVEGWQADIRHAYARGKTFIAPMQMGTGLQNKLLEAMAMELPCITTSLANDAIHATENEQIFVCNNAGEMATQIRLLQKDLALAASTGKAGRKFVESNYSWARCVEELNTIFRIQH
ncbi:MAG: glycosyltransferase [Flavobacteriia bacterium]|nr:glycosyltransferase [Flavobacteriia bacterium]